MSRSILIVVLVIFFAFGILFTSIMRSAQIKYFFSSAKPSVTDVASSEEKKKLESMQINYYLAYPGTILPDSLLWPVKAARDKIWLLITTNQMRKAELNLLFADKRLVSAKILFEKGKPEIGLATLIKAEKYLENACRIEEEIRKRRVDTSVFLERLVYASLKHKQVIDEIILLAPEDARPKIILIENYAEKVFSDKTGVLKERGMAVPENPFQW